VTDDVRVALIGAGRIARVHADAYRSVGGGRITTCFDPVAGVAESLARDFGLTVAPTFDAILADRAIDAVIVASPNAVHPEQAIAALDAGKHVFCQKPIALGLAEADRVVEAAAATPRIFQPGFMLRFTPPFDTVAGRIQAGDLGRIITSRASIFGWEPTGEWFYDPAQGGGVILDTLIHFCDLVLWLFGPAERVHTEGGPYVLEPAIRRGSPDNATVTIRHTSGAVSDLYVTWTAGHGNLRFEVYGANGSADIDLLTGQVTRWFGTGSDPMTVPTGWSYPDLVWPYGYRGEQQHFVDRISGRAVAPQAATARDGRDALALALAAQRSLDDATTVVLA
jgi:myo-inositol 2-dehydrogenase/D-chiro-inositol 1-dehydrogenase